MEDQEYYSRMKQELNEIQWRHFLGLEALRRGHGGINQVMKLTGAAWQTIKNGLEEIRKGTPYVPGVRIRKQGGGRKKLTEQQPNVADVVERIADPKGNPMSPIRWTTFSMVHIAEAVTALGYRISPMSTYRILKQKGFALKANKKEIEGKTSHPDRDAQFAHLAARGLKFQMQGVPILSIDCKKTELVGDFKNHGREWQPRGVSEVVQVYDFGEKDAHGERIKAIPYGIYNVMKNQGFVNVGITHNTAEFAVESIRRYWEYEGKQTYPDITELFLLADAGSSNGIHNHLWKYRLQLLANATGLTIHVSHYPPGTSKWNAIEHQLFSFISMNWRAKPLVSYEVILELLNHTTTKAGLQVKAMLDTQLYETGKKVSQEDWQALRLQGDPFHPEWNYSIMPQGHD